MDKDALKNYGIGTLTLVLLVSLGFNVQPDANYFSRDLGIGKYCDHLSSTLKTCYPYASTNLGSKYSSSGWEKIAQPATKPVSSECSYSGEGAAYCCGVGGCAQI